MYKIAFYALKKESKITVHYGYIFPVFEIHKTNLGGVTRNKRAFISLKTSWVNKCTDIIPLLHDCVSICREKFARITASLVYRTTNIGNLTLSFEKLPECFLESTRRPKISMLTRRLSKMSRGSKAFTFRRLANGVGRFLMNIMHSMPGKKLIKQNKPKTYWFVIRNLCECTTNNNSGLGDVFWTC